MTLKQYKAFVYSVDCGSISKAGEKLGSSQTAITHLINGLESEVGFSLMTRNKKGITLTAEGKRLYSCMKDVIYYNDRLDACIEKIMQDNKLSVNIGTFTSVAVNWLPEIMNGFKKLHPDVEFTITDGGYGEIITALNNGVADIGFISTENENQKGVYPLVKDRILAVLPIGHKYSNLKAFPVEFFKNESVISLTETTDFDSRRVFEKAGITPNICYRTADDYAMLSMVENELGICLVPELLLGKRTANVKVMELDPPAFRTIALAVPNEENARPIVKELANYIISYAKIKTLNLL